MEIKQSQFRCRLLSTKNRWNYTYDQTVDAHKMKVFTKHFYAFHFAVFFRNLHICSMRLYAGSNCNEYLAQETKVYVSNAVHITSFQHNDVCFEYRID